jgi:hypothetical protein
MSAAFCANADRCQASGNIEGGEQGRGAVTFVGMAEPCHGFAIGQQPPENAVVFSVDEKPHIQALERAQGWRCRPDAGTISPACVVIGAA